MKNISTNCPDSENRYHYFISQLSHEIRNPLTLIYSSLQLIEADTPSVADTDLWNQVKDDLRTVIHMLKDVSSLNNTDHLKLTPVVIGDFLSGIKTSFSALMHEKSIHFTVFCDPALQNRSISADRIKLQEAITNLLLNAAETTLSEHPGITCSAVAENGFLAFHVKDNGPGIPEEYLDTLFDPFVTHRQNGTGLGLSIVKKVATLHGGSISVTTCTKEPKTGTDFCLRLPLQNITTT